MVAIGDATHLGDSWILVIRDPNLSENVYMQEAYSETTSGYQTAHKTLEGKGFRFSAFVGDGRIAVPWLFSDIPVQMCHFHQLQIVIRYTTRHPDLPAGIELLALAKTLAHTDKSTFIDAFHLWCEKWRKFLNEKTRNAKTGRWQYTHRRLRAARTSVRMHLPYLFTYLDYPELSIPNTANSLDGSFTKIKNAIGVHAGLTHERKLRLVKSLLMGKE